VEETRKTLWQKWSIKTLKTHSLVHGILLLYSAISSCAAEKIKVDKKLFFPLGRNPPKVLL